MVLGLSEFIINPAASEMLGFFRRCSSFRSGDVDRRLCIRFSNIGVDASIRTVKSGMLLGLDMMREKEKR